MSKKDPERAYLAGGGAGLPGRRADPGAAFGAAPPVEHKGEIDLVTAIDRRSEDADPRDHRARLPRARGPRRGERPARRGRRAPLGRRPARRDDQLLPGLPVLLRLGGARPRRAGGRRGGLPAAARRAVHRDPRPRGASSTGGPCGSRGRRASTRRSWRPASPTTSAAAAAPTSTTSPASPPAAWRSAGPARRPSTWPTSPPGASTASGS